MTLDDFITLGFILCLFAVVIFCDPMALPYCLAEIADFIRWTFNQNG